MTQESQLELETGSSESSPPSHSESSAQSCQTLTLDLRDLHQGQELFISMEGAPIRELEIIAKHIILQLNNFPIYLLAASNTMIGKII